MLAEGREMSKVTGYSSQTRIVALTSVLSGLVAVMTMTAIPLPPPLSTFTLAPVIIFVTSILLGPKAGFVSAAIGSAIGYVAGTTIGTIYIFPGYFYVYLIGLVVARAPMGFAVGLLRKENEFLAMIIGVVVETLIFFTIDFYLFGFAIAVIDFGTLIDLASVPIAYAVLVALRRTLNTRYLA